MKKKIITFCAIFCLTILSVGCSGSGSYDFKIDKTLAYNNDSYVTRLNELQMLADYNYSRTFYFDDVGGEDEGAVEMLVMGMFDDEYSGGMKNTQLRIYGDGDDGSTTLLACYTLNLERLSEGRRMNAKAEDAIGYFCLIKAQNGDYYLVVDQDCLYTVTVQNPTNETEFYFTATHEFYVQNISNFSRERSPNYQVEGERYSKYEYGNIWQYIEIPQGGWLRDGTDISGGESGFQECISSIIDGAELIMIGGRFDVADNASSHGIPASLYEQTPRALTLDEAKEYTR